MSDTTKWEQKPGNTVLHSSAPQSGEDGGSNLLKAGLVIAAGLIIAALAKGVKDSDYYD